MRVGNLMTENPECTTPTTDLRAVAERMRDLDVGSLPVCGENDQLVGMVTDRDIVIRAIAEGQDPAVTRVEDVMTSDVVYCFDDVDIEEASQKMKEFQLRRIVVLNRDRRLVGILSLGDLAVAGDDTHLSGNTLEAVSEPAAPNR